MKRIIYYFGVILLASSIIACSSNEEPVPGSIQLDKGTQTEQVVYADETSKSEGIKFTAAAPWTATVKEINAKSRASEVEWLKLNVYGGGAGEHTLSLTLLPNLTGEDRVAEIVITCGDTVIRIRVEQKGTKQDGQKPEITNKTRLVDNIVSIYKGNGKWSSRVILEFSYNEKGKVTLLAIYSDANHNQKIDEEERAKGPKQKTEITYNEAAKTAYAKCWSYNEYDGEYIHEYNIKFNNEGYAVEMDSETNNDGFVETYKYTYQDGYIQSSKATEKGETSEYYEIPEWTNGNLTKVTCGRGNSIFDESVVEYSEILNSPEVSIDLNFIASSSYAYNNFCEDSNNGLKAFGFFGKRSKNMIAKEKQLATKENPETFYCTFKYETDANGYVTKIFATEPHDSYTIEDQYIINYK